MEISSCKRIEMQPTFSCNIFSNTLINTVDVYLILDFCWWRPVIPVIFRSLLEETKKYSVLNCPNQLICLSDVYFSNANTNTKDICSKVIWLPPVSKTSQELWMLSSVTLYSQVLMFWGSPLSIMSRFSQISGLKEVSLKVFSECICHCICLCQVMSRRPQVSKIAF